MLYEHWKLFIEAAEQGSLSKVAAIHATSQPLISKKISELETQCGGRLFHRTGRGVVLTELGQTLLPKIQRWLSDTESLHHDIQSLAGQPVGHIRLGALPSTIPALVVPLYEQLRNHYPFIRLSVMEGQGAQLEHWLQEGRIDLALLFRHQLTPLPGDECLSQFPTWLVSRRDDPHTRADNIAFAMLDGLPLITFCRPNSWRNVLDQLAHEQGIRLNIICEADSLTMQAQIAAKGHAYALLGESALISAQLHYPLDAARIVTPEIFHYLVLGVSRQGKFGIAARTVVTLIKTLARQTQAAVPGV